MTPSENQKTHPAEKKLTVDELQSILTEHEAEWWETRDGQFVTTWWMTDKYGAVHATADADDYGGYVAAFGHYVTPAVAFEQAEKGEISDEWLHNNVLEDPEVAKLRKENRRLAAENALLRAKLAKSATE